MERLTAEQVRYLRTLLTHQVTYVEGNPLAYQILEIINVDLWERGADDCMNPATDEPAVQHSPEMCGCEYRGNDAWSCGHIDNA